MSRLWTISFCTMVTMTASLAFAAPPDASPSFEKQVRPLIVENCLTCHNSEKKKGDLDLSRFETTDKAMASEEVWRDVADRLRAGDMPPKKARKHPTEEDRKTILAWIDAHVSQGESDCTKIATDKTQKYYRGYVMSRRLTRAEYNNTIRD